MPANVMSLIRSKIKEGIFKASAKSVSLQLNYGEQESVNVSESVDSYRKLNDGAWYLSPQDLVRHKVDLKKILVIGSCLSEELVGIWRNTIESISRGTEVDFILSNHLGELPTNVSQDANYDFQVIQLPLQDTMSEFAYFRICVDTPEKLPEFLHETVNKTLLALEQSLNHAHINGTETFILGFLPPQVNPFGKLQPRFDLTNIAYFVENINVEISKLTEKYAYVHYVDFDGFVSAFGKKHFQDDMVWQSSHGSFLTFADQIGDRQRLTPVAPMSEHYTMMYPQLMGWLWTELVSLYRTIKGVDQVKVVAVDLDDTLWRGVAADGGTFDSYGWPVGLAESLLWLKKRGILLATVSKNDEDFIRNKWDTLTEGRIRWDDFSLHMINFNSKPENLLSVAQKLNVGLDSIVFIDDNPVERQQVKQMLPDVRVIGDDPLYLKRILLWSAETQRPVITRESAERTVMVQAQLRRESDRDNLDRNTFLRALSLVVKMETINELNHPDMPRVLELINKTNQVNTTGARYKWEDIKEFFDCGSQFIAISVTDKYTSYGIVGVVILNGTRIEQLVMSCRVMGLGVEDAIVSTVIEQMHSDLSKISIRVIVTERNAPIRDVLVKQGWISSPEEEAIWVAGDLLDLKCPTHIMVELQ